MPLPDSKKLSEHGSLEGFTWKGLVGTEQSYRGRGRTFEAHEGKFFARLDQLRPLDSNHLRDLTGVPQQDHPVDTSLIVLRNSDGTLTHGVDGAYLECEDVTIPVGHTLLFHYNFIAGDRTIKNDFAVLELYPDDETDKPPILREVIHDTRMLDAARRVQTGWVPFSPLQFPQGFKGTVRWVVSNGRTPSMTVGEGKARPSCLLLNVIKILGS